MAEGATAAVLASLAEEGYPASTVPVERLGDLREGIAELHRQGQLSDAIFDGYRPFFEPAVPESLPRAASIIVAAVGQPRFRLTFHYEGRSHQAVVPPHYDTSLDETVRETIERVVGPRGYTVRWAPLPAKQLAVRGGLADYGRNNISYVEGLGSFHRLVAFFTDAPLEDGGWRRPTMLEACRRCVACVAACPTGAITRDRFLIRAERCLTYHNESSEPFPEWIDPAWHNSLIGCTRCQDVCPVDRPLRNRLEDAGTFTETETALLLAGTAASRLPAETRARLARFTGLDDMRLAGRNLSVLLAGEREER